MAETPPMPAALAERIEASKLSKIRRHAERAVPDQVEAILNAGRVAHVAYAIDGQPYMLPFTYSYADGRLYLHGAPASRTIKALRAGTPVAVEITILDGLIASREAQSHSMNYRSVVVFGRAELVADLAEKRAALEEMTLRYFPDRQAGRDYTPAPDNHLRAVDLLVVAIDEVSAKSRIGGPRGPQDGDENAFGSAFVVTLPEMDV
ncbi:MAG: pyridoxamine 5'-phosphate oxidase family protein [Ktedonobacterales bacterium]